MKNEKHAFAFIKKSQKRSNNNDDGNNNQFMHIFVRDDLRKK